MTVRQFDTVKTRRVVSDGLAAGGMLPAGSRGTVVLVHEKPIQAYEVEFLDDKGNTIGLPTLEADDIEKAA